MKVGDLVTVTGGLSGTVHKESIGMIMRWGIGANNHGVWVKWMKLGDLSTNHERWHPTVFLEKVC